MKQTTIVAIILGVLVLISVVQAFQLGGLKSKLAEEKTITTGSSSVKTVPLSSSGDTAKRTASLPTSVKELPQMVGGC